MNKDKSTIKSSSRPPMFYSSLTWNNPMDDLITITKNVRSYFELQDKFYKLHHAYKDLYNEYNKLKNKEIYRQYGFLLKPVCIYCNKIYGEGLNCSNSYCVNKR